MKKVRHLILLALVCFCCTLQAWAGYSGTPTAPVQISAENYSSYGFTASNYSAFVGYYGISNAEELYGFAAKVNSGSTSINGVLTADIVVNDSVLKADGSLIDGADTALVAWTPIGTSNRQYSGTFDGNGHTVSGLYFYNTTSGRYPSGGDYVGLIGCCTGNTAIKNVGVIDSYLHGTFDVGAILGYTSSNSTITNCFNTSTIIASASYACAGGICGYNGNCTITNCYSTGKIRANGKYVGGIVGEKGGTISNCFYLDSCAFDGSNKVQYGIGNSSQGSSTADVAGCTISATADDFASGKIAYLLNGSENGVAGWYQKLSSPVDSLPVLDATRGKVWRGCGEVYVNDPDDAPHSYVDGICTVCGEYMEPTLVADAAIADSLGLTEDYVGFYAIENGAQLYWFAQKVNGGSTAIKGVLTADIALNDSVLRADGSLIGGADTALVAWTPIGNSSYNYSGTFDGNGHTISGLYFNNTSSSNVGLFGRVSNPTIKNVGLVDSYIKGNQYMGGICGYINGGAQITNCYNEATVYATSHQAGGICGYMNSSSAVINGCYNTGYVSGYYQHMGGICGYQSYGAITNSYNVGKVYSSAGNGTSNYANVGGISGYMTNSASIANCYNTGDVESYGYSAGGIVGYIKSSSNKVTNCYNTGSVKASSYVGGIYGYCSNSSAVLTNNFALSGTATGCDGGQFATADEFASGKVTFALNNSKSDSSIVWFQTIDTDSLPVFDKTHSTVYASEPCHTAFANSALEANPHTFDESGICTVCGAKMPATFVADAAVADSLGLDEKYVGYYAISKPVQLYWFAEQVNSGSTSINGVLQNSIVVNDSVLTEDGSLKGTPAQTWTPIGNSSYKYAGVFDGQGHTISGVYINGSNSYVGLFGYIDAGTVKNVVLADSYIAGYQYVGGICGYISGAAQISNCHNSATVYASYDGDACAGGICGYMYVSSATISNCTNNGYISVYRRNVGGICGYQSSGTITNCHNNGRIYANAGNSTGNYSYAGGISGYMDNYSYANISYCYNTGAVEGKGTYTGGITGRIYGKITYCYNVGAVTASSNVGAIYGYNNSANCSNNYALSGSAINNWGGTFVTAEEFANGRVAYLLNNSKSDSTVVWRQNIGTDSLPVYDNTHSIVYLAAPCAVYSNSTEKEHGTCNVLGQCLDCGKYITAPLYHGAVVESC